METLAVFRCKEIGLTKDNLIVFILDLDSNSRTLDLPHAGSITPPLEELFPSTTCVEKFDRLHRLLSHVTLSCSVQKKKVITNLKQNVVYFIIATTGTQYHYFVIQIGYFIFLNIYLIIIFVLKR